MISLPAAADDDEVELLTGSTAAIMAGTDSWVALNWTAEEDVSNFRVDLNSATDGVVVSYPDNLGTWSGLAGGHYLDEDEVDYTALKVSIPSSFTKKYAKIKLNVSYELEGETETGKFSFKVPVTQFSGDADLSQTSDTAGVSGSGWVAVSFAGHAPRSGGFAMVVTDAAGLEVIYPSADTSTSLHADAELVALESDVARFYVDASAVPPGDYPVAIEVTYDAGAGRKTLGGMVTVTVAG